MGNFQSGNGNSGAYLSFLLFFLLIFNLMHYVKSQGGEGGEECELTSCRPGLFHFAYKIQ